MPKSFDFFFDLSSPYSYLASTQLAGIEQRSGWKARLLPITLGGLRKVTGHQMPPAVQLQYMAQDTARWAQQYGVRMLIPASFPVSTIQALRACIAADLQCSGVPPSPGRRPVGALQEKGAAAMHALFGAYWVEGRDISDAAVIERALTAAGLDGKALQKASQEQEIKDVLRRNTDLAFARGVFGVPTIFVGERSFWGNDRLQFVERELRAQD